MTLVGEILWPVTLRTVSWCRASRKLGTLQLVIAKLPFPLLLANKLVIAATIS